MILRSFSTAPSLAAVTALIVFAMNPVDATGADLNESGWQSWTPRKEITPVFRRDDLVGHDRAGSLSIESGGSVAAFGAWKQTVTNIAPGTTYRFNAWYRVEDIENERRSVMPRLLWMNERGDSVRSPDFAFGKPMKDGWSEVDYITRSPVDATQVEIQLGFGFASDGRVWWDDVTLVEEPNPTTRNVRVATIHHKPRGTKSAAESVAEFAELVEKAAAEHPDIICLPEGITVVGNPQSYIEVSEAVPGLTTKLLGDLARKHRCYIVAGIYERVGKIVYNTAVLIDRKGNLAGTYRKTHLPREEWEAGLTPGGEYPVFDTDFGRVGLMICWDVQFPEPARAMALQGAELILLPIWGGNEILARARAIENHVFLVSSTYDMRSFIVDPAGAILAEATADDPVAVAEIDLDRQIFQPWLGDMKYRTWKERRPDIPVELTTD
jgi:predicted amidohydrolase